MTAAESYSKVKQALKSGKIIRPKECAKCLSDPGMASDGRSLLHAHHEDYSRPLDVRWLCVKCHRKITRLPLRERNGVAVLRVGLVQAAMLLNNEGFAISDIAEFYGVSRPALSSALSGRSSWLAERERSAK